MDCERGRFSDKRICYPWQWRALNRIVADITEGSLGPWPSLGRRGSQPSIWGLALWFSQVYGFAKALRSIAYKPQVITKVAQIWVFGNRMCDKLRPCRKKKSRLSYCSLSVLTISPVLYYKENLELGSQVMVPLPPQVFQVSDLWHLPLKSSVIKFVS